MNDSAPKVERRAIRALAEQHFADLERHIAAGGNGYQLSLEQQDSVKAIAAKLSPEDASTYITVYAEEQHACAMKAKDDAKRIQAEAEEHFARAEAVRIQKEEEAVLDDASRIGAKIGKAIGWLIVVGFAAYFAIKWLSEG